MDLIRSSDSPVSLLKWAWSLLDPLPPATGVVALSVQGVDLAALRALAPFTTRPHFRVRGNLLDSSVNNPTIGEVSERARAFLWTIHFEWGSATLSKLRSGDLWAYSVRCSSRGPRFHRSLDMPIRHFWETCHAMSRHYERSAEAVRPPFGSPRRLVEMSLFFRSEPVGIERELARLLEVLPKFPQQVHGTVTGGLSFVEDVAEWFTECSEDCCRGMFSYSSLDRPEDNIDHAMLTTVGELLVKASPKDESFLWFEGFRFNHPVALDYKELVLAWRLLRGGSSARLELGDLQGDLEEEEVEARAE